MDFNGKAVLVYLEEDNIAKAYFRIKPLLCADGPITQDILSSLPDEGFLRIVPDRNEQHTFKERMRNMCGLCMMDLRNQPPEANKIRTNKNYSPAHGENNQYIIYSDAVRAIEGELFYQVIAQNEIEKAVTPVIYIRNGANMQGPFKKGEPVTDNASQLPPDSQGLYSVSLNGQELLFYWPKAKELSEADKPSAAETKTADEAPEEKKPQSALDQIVEINQQVVSKAANLLSEPVAEPTFIPKQQQPLNGTKLYSSGQKNSSFRRAHNPLMETVELQRYTSKPEAPGAVVNDSTALKNVINPIDAFKRSIQKVCVNGDDCRQAVDIILSCPGMQQALSSAMSSNEKNLTISAMHNQLQELEAERLMTLMQLDDAKKEASFLKKEAIDEYIQSNKAEQDKLNAARNNLASEIAAQEIALLALNKKQAEANETLENALNDGCTSVIVRKIGLSVSEKELTDRLENLLKASGFICKPGDALAILTAYALTTDCIYLCAESDADAISAADVLSKLFDAPLYSNKAKEKTLLAPGGNTPVFIRTETRKNCTCVLLPSDTEELSSDFMMLPFAMLHFSADYAAIPEETKTLTAISINSLQQFVHDSKLNDDTIACLNAFRKIGQNAALPISRFKNALRFIASTQNAFRGGVAEAIDRAVAMFVLPHYIFNCDKHEEVSLLLSAMPRSLAIWNKVK